MWTTLENWTHQPIIHCSQNVHVVPRAQASIEVNGERRTDG